MPPNPTRMWATRDGPLFDLDDLRVHDIPPPPPPRRSPTPMFRFVLLLCILALTSALNAGVSARVPSRTAVTMSATGRRAAVAGLFAATLAQSASAKTIEEIAAESNKAAVADREAAAAAPVRAATPRPAAPCGASPPAPPHLPHRCPRAGAGRGREQAAADHRHRRRRHAALDGLLRREPQAPRHEGRERRQGRRLHEVVEPAPPVSGRRRLNHTPPRSR